MGCVKALWLLLVLVLVSLVQSKEYCDFVDVKCMTLAARNVMKTAGAGIEGLIEPIDPLFTGDIKGMIPGTKYSLSNPKMTGLKDCQIVHLVFQPDEITFECEMYCPLLVFNYGYEGKGTLDSLKIDGAGQAKVTLHDYVILLKGPTERFISEVDNKLRVIVKDFTVETEPKGNITFEVPNLVRGDKDKSDQAEAYLNEHAMDLEPYMRTAVIEKFMRVFIERLNTMFTTFPFEKVAPKI